MSRFVWRLQPEDGEATALPSYDDDRIPVDMSVWESIEAPAACVYRPPQVEVIRQRRERFEKMAEAFMAFPSAQPQLPLPDQCPAG